MSNMTTVQNKWIDLGDVIAVRHGQLVLVAIHPEGQPNAEYHLVRYDARRDLWISEEDHKPYSGGLYVMLLPECPGSSYPLMDATDEFGRHLPLPTAE